MCFNANLYSSTLYQGQKISLIFGLVNIHSVIRRVNGYIMDLKTCTKKRSKSIMILWIYDFCFCGHKFDEIYLDVTITALHETQVILDLMINLDCFFKIGIRLCEKVYARITIYITKVLNLQKKGILYIKQLMPFTIIKYDLRGASYSVNIFSQCRER